MAHMLYPNQVLENKITDLLNTKVNARALATIDTSLVENAGMKKAVNKYSYNGEVESLAKGIGNSTAGTVSYTSVDYTVEVLQQKFRYQSEDIMTDPMILDAGMEGSATVMVNDLNDRVFAEFAKATNKSERAKDEPLNYDAVVDGIASMNIEDEAGLFLVIGTDKKAELRKDPDFKGARLGEILFNGQIGSIAGVPVVVSKLINAKEAILATKDAVTIFFKKDSEVEQERDADTRTNDVFLRRVAVVALTNEAAIVKLTQKAV